jgi:RNase P subunit RPR2
MIKLDLMTRLITHGTSEEVRRLSCPKCSGSLKIGIHRGARLVSAQVKCTKCDFIVRLDGLPSEPPWAEALGREFETKP